MIKAALLIRPIDQRSDQQSQLGFVRSISSLAKTANRPSSTIVDRKSKFSLRRKVRRKAAQAVASVTIELRRSYREKTSIDLTRGLGKEFSPSEDGQNTRVRLLFPSSILTPGKVD